MDTIILKNNFKYNLPSDSRLLLFGANRIGKTLISKGINEFYENTNDIKPLLFNDDMMQSSFITNVENSNRYVVTPFAREKQVLKADLSKIRKELELLPVLKKHFNETTTKAYEKFPILSSKLNKTVLNKSEKFEVYPGDLSQVEFAEPIFDFDNFNVDFKYSEDFITKCINKKNGIYRFLELIDSLEKDGIFNKIRSKNDLFDGIEQDVYFVKEKIINENYSECPVCYSIIDEEKKTKIIADLSKVIINDEIKKSLDYYLKDIEFEKVVVNLISDYKYHYSKFLSDLETSIISIISKDFNIKTISEYQRQMSDLEKINIETKNFIIKQENKESPIYKKVGEEIESFNKFSNANLEYAINSGQLEITFPKGFLNELSMSEQKLLKFIYFRILFLQNIKAKPSLKFAVVIDDPFDSYDDVYVSSMIEIVFDLLKIYKTNIEKFIVLSHSFHSLKLLSDQYNDKNVNFKFQWLEIFKENDEIVNINDQLKIMTKIDKNISDFGFAMQIIKKMRDPYSLIVFSSLLRENSKFNSIITMKPSRTVKKTINIHENYYSIISEGVNHRKTVLSVRKLFKINENLYGFPKIIFSENDTKYVSDVFDKITIDYKDLELIRLFPKDGPKIWKENDLMHLLIWKFLAVIKIRRTLEKNIWIEKSKPKYKTLGDLVKMYDEKNTSENYKFYIDYKNLFNSFNHTTTENIPPFLIFHTKYIQEALERIEKI